MISQLINAIAEMTPQYKLLLCKEDEYNKLQNILDNTRCKLELDADGNIVSINELLLHLLKYTEAEVMKQPYHMLTKNLGSDKDSFRAIWQEITNLNLHNGEFTLRDNSGQDILFQGFHIPVLNKKRTLKKVVAYMTPVNKRITSSSNENYHGMNLLEALDGSSSAVMAVDRNFIVTYVNEATRKLFNDNLEELKKAFPSFDPTNIVGMCIDIFHRKPEHQRKLLANPKNLPYTTVIKVGSMNIRLHITASHDSQGNYIGNILEWRDVTKEMSDAGQLAAISKVMGIIEFDMAGNILSVNENFAHFTGYQKKEVIGKNHHMLVTAEFGSSEKYRIFWNNLLQGGYERSRQQFVGKGGKELWFDASYNPILDMSGKPFKVVTYLTDITQVVLKERDELRRTTEALMIKNALDCASINVMVADNEGIIQYLNPSVQKLMQDSVLTFKKVIPNFDPKKLLGQNFDVFHKKPSHQRSLLSELKSTYTTELQLGEMYFKLSASPLFTEKGDRLGTVLEWQNTTDEKHIETEIKAIVESAVGGDLSQRLSTYGRNGNVAKTMDGLNQLLDAMSRVLAEVKQAAETINTAAGEISTGNTYLSQRTEQQASALEEIASSMEQLSATVKQNAENAKLADELALAASNVAEKGGVVVSDVVRTMSAIQESSKQIEDIIAVIDGIAFQTNILALNAAVEAARAGEQGRGFAVVAGEVRNLAQRSASAAKEIKELISDSVLKVSTGTLLVENAGVTMQEIVSSVQKVTDIMSEITAASQEQSIGINQVNTAIITMDGMTQQNAALVEEAASASIALVNQAEKLNHSVSDFKY